MPSRQKNLILGLVTAVLIWQGGIWINHWLLEPLRLLRAELVRKEDKVIGLRDQVFAIDLAKGKLATWKTRSLSPDPVKKTRSETRLDAVEAHRQYLVWLNELAHTVGFDDVNVTPHRNPSPRENVYVDVSVQIVGEGRFSQLAELLDRFYRTDLLQRVNRLQITSFDVVGNPPVKFTMEVSALALAGAPPRRTIFPRTTLAEELPATAAQLQVVAAAEFPKKTPFEIRADRELLSVTGLAGDTWTVLRGVERTARADHAAKTPVTLVPINPNSREMSLEEFREFWQTNIFVKPTPPQQYDLKFGPFASVVVVKGKSWEYSIAAKDYDPARGEPTYRIQGDAPKGLTLNEATGQIVWKPDAKQPAGNYPIEVSVKHPSAPEGRLVTELPLVLAEPNTPPKFKSIGPQKVYRGQPWQITVIAEDSDRPQQELTFKLGTGAPAGCEIDAKTGELTWTPDDSQAAGAVSIMVSATDDGTPSKTSNVTIPVTVMEDTAKQTFLAGIVDINDERKAWFRDNSQDRNTYLRVGDEIRIADISAEIIEIAATQVMVRRGESDYRLKLGATVRSLSNAAAITPPTDSVETPN